MIRRKVDKDKRSVQVLIAFLVIVGIVAYVYTCYKMIKPPVSNGVTTEQKDSDGYTVATGIVEKVVSGDTVEVKVGDKLEMVRLEGLAIPVAMKDKAMEYTKAQLEGKVIELHYLEENYSPEIQKYGRLAAYIYFKHYLYGGGLLEKGLAIFLTSQDLKGNPYTSKYYASAEEKAKETGEGIWNIAKDKGSIALEQALGEAKNNITNSVNETAPKLTNSIGEKIREGTNVGINTLKTMLNNVSK